MKESLFSFVYTSERSNKMTNTNNHITLLAKLGIDTSNRQEIQQQIDEFAKKETS